MDKLINDCINRQRFWSTKNGSEPNTFLGSRSKYNNKSNLKNKQTNKQQQQTQKQSVIPKVQ